MSGMTRRRFMAGAVATAVSCLGGSGRAGAAKGDTWQIGCYTRPWRDQEYRVALDAIAEAGFRYAGLMSIKSKSGRVIAVDTTVDEAREIGEECRKRGLGIPSVSGGAFPIKESLAAGIAGVKRLVDNCAAAGATNLLVNGTGDMAIFDAYYKAIEENCDYAASLGIGISVKPHGGANGTGEACRSIIEKVNKPNFRLMYDPGNVMHYSDGAVDPVADAAMVNGIVSGMCVKDWEKPKNVNVTPGDGLVDFPGVMARLKAGGFTGGPLVIECVKEGNLKESIVEARRARLMLEELVKTLG